MRANPPPQGGPALRRAGLADALAGLDEFSGDAWWRGVDVAERLKRLPIIAAEARLAPAGAPLSRAFARFVPEVLHAALRGAEDSGGGGSSDSGSGGGSKQQQLQHNQEQQQQLQHSQEQHQQQPAKQQQEQQQQQQQRRRPYDAVLVGGSRLFSQTLLAGFERAAADFGASYLPPRVLFLPHVYSDPRSGAGEARAWARVADHVMCASAPEAARAAAAGAPASAVGHPLLRALQARADSGGGGGAELNGGGGGSSSGSGGGSGSKVGSSKQQAADRLAWLRERAAAAAAAAADKAPRDGGNDGAVAPAPAPTVRFATGSAERFWRWVEAGHGGVIPAASSEHGGGGGGDDDPRELVRAARARPLVALLPGCHEADLQANLYVYGEEKGGGC